MLAMMTLNKHFVLVRRRPRYPDPVPPDSALTVLLDGKRFSALISP